MNLGFVDGILSDVQGFEAHQAPRGGIRLLRWRSGVKHDCSRSCEVSTSATDILINGHRRGRRREDVFPLLKSSDVANCRLLIDEIALDAEGSGQRGMRPRFAKKAPQNLGISQ
jgi:hypothetical protein